MRKTRITLICLLFSTALVAQNKITYRIHLDNPHHRQLRDKGFVSLLIKAAIVESVPAFDFIKATPQKLKGSLVKRSFLKHADLPAGVEDIDIAAEAIDDFFLIGKETDGQWKSEWLRIRKRWNEETTSYYFRFGDLKNILESVSLYNAANLADSCNAFSFIKNRKFIPFETVIETNGKIVKLDRYDSLKDPSTIAGRESHRFFDHAGVRYSEKDDPGYYNVYIVREHVNLNHQWNHPLIVLRDSLYTGGMNGRQQAYEFDGLHLNAIDAQQLIDMVAVSVVNDNVEEYPSGKVVPSATIFENLYIIKQVTITGALRKAESKLIGLQLVTGSNSVSGAQEPKFAFQIPACLKKLSVAWVHPVDQRQRVDFAEALSRKFYEVDYIKAQNKAGDFISSENIDDQFREKYKNHVLYELVTAPYATTNDEWKKSKQGFSVWRIRRYVDKLVKGNEILTSEELQSEIINLLMKRKLVSGPLSVQGLDVVEKVQHTNGKNSFTTVELVFRGADEARYAISFDDRAAFATKNLKKLKRWIEKRSFEGTIVEIEDAYGQPIDIPAKERGNKNYIPSI